MTLSYDRTARPILMHYRALLLISIVLVSCSGEGGSSQAETDANETRIGTDVVERVLIANAVSVDLPYRIVLDSIVRKSKTLPYTVRAVYPRLAYPSVRAIERHFNDAFVRDVLKAIEEFTMEASEVAEGFSEFDNIGSSYFTTTTTLHLMTPELFNLQLSVDRYYTGGAHPVTLEECYTYDLKEGRFLTLGDFFSPGSGYRDVISSYVIDDLMQDPYADSLAITGSAAPELADDWDFMLSEQWLTVHFDVYEVASYAEGPKFVHIPWSVVEPMLKPDIVTALRLEPVP